jgi:hypothetical protein
MALQNWVKDKRQVTYTSVWKNPENENNKGREFPNRALWGADLRAYLPAAPGDLFVAREFVPANSSEIGVDCIKLVLTGGGWMQQARDLIEPLEFIEKAEDKSLIAANFLSNDMDAWRMTGPIELVRSNDLKFISFKVSMFSKGNVAGGVARSVYAAAYWCWPD